jgi:hypothetical protein
MHRILSLPLALALALAGGATAAADPPDPAAPPPPPAAAPAASDPTPTPPTAATPSITPSTGSDAAPATVTDDMGDQAIGGQLGVGIGGNVTPGGLHLAGHYLYKLTDNDWFDSIAAFTYGGGAAACFHDRTGAFVCTHGIADGDAAELTGIVRHVFPAQGIYRPFAFAGIGLAIVHFSGDSLTGLVVPLHAGGGVRARVADDVAVVAQAELAFGVGEFGNGLGAAPQLGATITAGAEVTLR